MAIGKCEILKPIIDLMIVSVVCGGVIGMTIIGLFQTINVLIYPIAITQIIVEMILGGCIISSIIVNILLVVVD